MGRLLGNCDIDFFDSVAREVNELAGTCAILYYALEHVKVPKDPLWNEPKDLPHKLDPKKATVGIQFAGFIEYPEPSPRTGEEGRHVDYDATLWLARKDFEEKMPITPAPAVGLAYREPRYGDVVQVQGKFFDIVKIDQDGQLNDTINIHTMWMLRIRHRSEFDARRQIEGQT